jgi:hypothetical protein
MSPCTWPSSWGWRRSGPPYRCRRLRSLSTGTKDVTAIPATAGSGPLPLICSPNPAPGTSRRRSSAGARQVILSVCWPRDASIADARREYRTKSYSGAPRPTKMGNIVSPWRYDAAARHALQLANLRRPAILCCASWWLPSHPTVMSLRPTAVFSEGLPRLER